MKITLQRQMQLKVAELFLSLEKDVLSPNIKEYLNGNGYEDRMLNDGIRNYLKETGIYDDGFQLTKYGSYVKETGIFKDKEMGKYRVWLDRDRIVFLHRASAVDRDHDKLGSIVIRNEGFSISVHDENFYRFKLINPEEITGKHLKEDCFVDETIYINEDGSSTVFNGFFQNGLPVSDKPVLENVEFKDFSIWDIIEEIFPDDWDKVARRLKIQLKDINDNDIENLEMDYPGDWSLFNYKIDKLPIEPYDKTEAIKWRNKLLNKEIAKNYLTEKNFDGLVLSINEKEGFSSYKKTLDKPEIRNYLKDEIEPNSLEFWHLYAPMDLNPGIPKEMIADRFEIGKGESSMLQIVGKINFRDPEFVFYCDRHTDRVPQQKAIAAFLDSSGERTKYVITSTQTNEHNKRGSYLENQRKDIKVKFLKRQHRRCIVFYKNGEFQIWNLDDSIDFIKYNADEKLITPTTIGQIVRPVVFTKVSDRVLDKEILNFIQQEVKDA